MSQASIIRAEANTSPASRRAEYLRRPNVLRSIENIVAHLANIEAEDPEQAAFEYLLKSHQPPTTDQSMSGKLLECLMTSLESHRPTLLVPPDSTAVSHHPYFLRAQERCASVATATAVSLPALQQSLSDPDLIRALVRAASSIQNATEAAYDEEQLLGDLAKSVKDLLKADRCAVFVADSERKLLISEISGKEVVLRYGEGIAGSVALSLQPVFVANAYDDPRFSSMVDQQTGYFTKTILAVPIIATDSKLVAVVQVINKLDQSPFNEQDAQLFAAFAKFAAVRIRTGQLLQDARRSSLRNAKIADAIFNLNNANFAPETLIPAIISNAKAVVGCDRCSFFLVDEEQDKLVAHLEGIEGTVDLPIDAGIAGFVAQSRQPLVVPDAYADPRFNREVDLQSGYRTSNILCVPLIVNGKLVAVTQLINKLKPVVPKQGSGGSPSFSEGGGIASLNSSQNLFSSASRPLGSSISPSSASTSCTAFTSEDIATLTTFANIAACCLNNSIMLQDSITSNKLMTQSMELVSAVLGSSSGDMSEVTSLVAECGVAVGNCERCNVYLLDDNGNISTEDPDAGSSLLAGDESPSTISIPAGSHSLVTDAIRHDRPFVSNEWNTVGGQRTHSLFGSKIVVRQAAIIPITAVSGAITFVNSRTGGFTPGDIRNLASFAVFIGMAIRHAQLLAVSRSQNREFSNLMVFAVDTESSPSDIDAANVASIAASNNFTSTTVAGSLRTPRQGSIVSAQRRCSSARLVKSQSIVPPQDQLELLSTIEFDVHAYRYGQFSRDLLIPLLCHMFSAACTPLSLCPTLHVDPTKLHRFILRCEHHYRQVPYHNFFHAFDVTQTMFMNIMRGQLLNSVLTAQEVFTLLLTCIVHDIDHMGLNSTFHTKAETPLGVLTSLTGSKSALEVHHATIAIELITEEKLLDDMDKKDRSAILRSMVDLILNTDMAVHGQLMEQFNTTLLPRTAEGATCCCDMSAPAEVRRLAMIMLMKACDISNPAKPFDLSRKWGINVMEEFYRQGDEERAQGLDVTPMFDRDKKVQLAKSQIGFIQFVAGPFFNRVATCFPQLVFLNENVKSNVSRWNDVLEQTK